MTDEKKPPDAVVGASSLRWSVARDPAGPLELTIHDGGAESSVLLTPDEADFMALMLLINACDDFDAAATTQRLSALALTCQVVAHGHDSFKPGELTEGHNDISDVGGIVLDDVGDSG